MAYNSPFNALSDAIGMYMGLRQKKIDQDRLDAGQIRQSRLAQAQMVGNRPDVSPLGLQAAMQQIGGLGNITSGRDLGESPVDAAMRTHPLQGRTVEDIQAPPPAVADQLPEMGTGMPQEGSRSPQDIAEIVKKAQAIAAYNQGPKTRAVASEQMPMFRAPGEMAQEAGLMEGEQYGGRMAGQQRARADALRRLGATDQQIRDAMLADMTGTTRSLQQPYKFLLKDGTTMTAQLDKYGSGGWTDLNGRPIQLPPDADLISTGPINGLNFFQNDLGGVSGMSTNRFMPQNTERIPIPQGVQGRTSPEGPIVTIAGPNGEPQPVRTPRRGTGATPLTVPNPQAAPPPQTPAGPPAPPARVTAQGYKEIPQATADAMNAGKTGLEVLNILERTWKPEFTGTVQGRWNEVNQKYNPFTEGDPDFRTFQANWAGARNDLLRFNAGLSQTGQEKANTEQQIMMLNDKDENFLPALRALRANFERKMAATQQTAGQAVPFAGRGAGPGPGPATAPERKSVKLPNGTTVTAEKNAQGRWIIVQ